MAKAVKKFSGKKLDELYEIYDVARRAAKVAEDDKKEASNNIKELLGDVEEANTPNFFVTYKYDKDGTAFDEEKFEQKDPKGYAKYLDALANITAMQKKYIKLVKGARKLVVTAVAE